MSQRAGRSARDTAAIRDLYPAYFALVMATGICSTALRDIGRATASAVLLAIAVVCLVVLIGVLGLRLAWFPRRVLEDLSAPDWAYAFFTFVAACNVVAVRLAADGHRGAAVALASLGAAAWLALTYAVPVGLVLGRRPRPVLAGVNGTWFIWVVGTQSIAVSAAVLDRPAGGQARATALLAVLMWSVGVVLLSRGCNGHADPSAPARGTAGRSDAALLGNHGRDRDHRVRRGPDPRDAPGSGVDCDASRPRRARRGLVGVWHLVDPVAGDLRRVAARASPGAPGVPPLWSIVFPLGMYAVASMELGAVADLPIVEDIGRAWTWLAVLVWIVVFSAMCAHLGRSLLQRPPSPEQAMAAQATTHSDVAPASGRIGPLPSEPPRFGRRPRG